MNNTTTRYHLYSVFFDSPVTRDRRVINGIVAPSLAEALRLYPLFTERAEYAAALLFPGDEDTPDEHATPTAPSDEGAWLRQEADLRALGHTTLRCYRAGCDSPPIRSNEAAFVEHGVYDEDADSFESEYDAASYTCGNGHTFVIPQ